MFHLAFVAGWLQGHWWGFISRNYVVWPTFLPMNVFIALKGSHFWFLSDCTAKKKYIYFFSCPPIISKIKVFMYKSKSILVPFLKESSMQTFFFRFPHHIRTQDFKTFFIWPQNKRFKPISIRIKMIWIYIRHFFCYSQEHKCIWRTSPNSKSWRKNDVRWCYQRATFEMPFFLVLSLFLSHWSELSLPAIYAIIYCRTKVT